MSDEKLSLRIDMPLEQLEDVIHTSINGDFSGYNQIVSPRDLNEVRGMTFFREDVFQSLIRQIPLRGYPDCKPYEKAKIRVLAADPRGIKVGQNFLLERKILSILHNLQHRIFDAFVVGGISKMPPAQLYGLDNQGRKALAFYIPPFYEIHGEKIVVLDGIHRSKICGGAGTTINAIHLSGVAYPLPFDPLSWKEIRLTDEKPPIKQRYKNLREDLFRDLGAVGIDG